MSDPNYLLRDEPSGVAAADALMGVLGYRRVHDFREYATAARYAIEINAGCTAAMLGDPDNPYPANTVEADAWEFGYAQGGRK